MGKSLLFACLMPLMGMSQDFSQLAGGRSLGLSHSSVAIADAWSVCHNQAAMTELTETRIGASYEKPYFLNDVNLANFAVTRSVGEGALGLCFSYLGFDIYHESKLGLAYAHSFGKALSVGLKFSYDLISSPHADEKFSGITSSIGAFVHASDALRVGIHLNNINSIWKDATINQQPIALRLGLLYEVSNDLDITGEVYKQLNREESIRGGMEYRPGTVLALRLGMASAPFRQTLGFGYSFNNLHIDLAFEYKQVLGGTSNLSFQYTVP